MAFRKSDKLRPNGWQNIGIFDWKLTQLWMMERNYREYSENTSIKRDFPALFQIETMLKMVQAFTV